MFKKLRSRNQNQNFLLLHCQHCSASSLQCLFFSTMSFDEEFLNCDDFDLQFWIDEPVFPFENSPVPDLDILNTNSVSSNENQSNDSIPVNSFDDLSPPSQELNSLSLQNETHSAQFHSSLPDNNSGFYSENGFNSGFSSGFIDNSLSGIKLEDRFITAGNPHFDTTSFINSDEKMMMQRSFSSHFLDQKPNELFQTGFNPLMEIPHFPAFYEPMIRKVSSTGDLQRVDSSNGYSSSPLSATENCSLVDEAHFKAKPYTAEEKKHKIDRYRNKRTQRNFNKTIKYACRKTLADSRPRIRGRFARHDEPSFEIPKEDEDFWEQMYENNMVQGGGGRALCGNGYDRRYLHHSHSFNEQQYQYFNGNGTNWSTLPWNPALSASFSPQMLRSDW
ncbi:hypothetical protein C5167_004609 [Papaver somniferum]|uniref:CCT domain-containing protein n=1 Tax=Papaver somniferum TaxID=3469 RepID=A0A4Y7J907_PAPSO|nr:uncharacterized protein LOC113273536 [Papaver somniferum]RZC57307.1 hypothetical protein C5167_004609 [Papaver somniferum]